MTLTQVIKKLGPKLTAAKVTVRAKRRVLSAIKRDLVLPHFLCGKNLKVKTGRTATNAIWVEIGPRDWSFSSKGEFYGAGTLLV